MQLRHLSFPDVCKARWCDLYIRSHDGYEQLSAQITCQRLFERKSLRERTPRAFVPYDCSTPPEPSHFRYAILNFFEEPVTRVNFLNKFYQCLLASRMPHKVSKFVVVGPRDSGKTSWANVFYHVVPSEFIASITNERQFSAAMIKDDT